MDQVTVHVETEINPTETEEKVKTAVFNILGGKVSVTVKPDLKGSVFVAEASGQDSLVKLRNLLRTDRIRDASRKALFHSIRGSSICFCLNKQVAFAGHVSFSEETAESPLGPIRVTITSETPQQLVEWLAEKTK
ncbi:MAG: RNA-binding domain-containing protein [Candidatus Bathyarchaeia archaeon]